AVKASRCRAWWKVWGRAGGDNLATLSSRLPGLAEGEVNSAGKLVLPGGSKIARVGYRQVGRERDVGGQTQGKVLQGQPGPRVRRRMPNFGLRYLG
ncbi:MAG: hypothetical protein ACK53L_18370, partial [Pirellulaceae bacterium]